MEHDSLEPPHRPGRRFIGSAFFSVTAGEGCRRRARPRSDVWENALGVQTFLRRVVGSLVDGVRPGIFGHGQGNLIALDAATGRDLWHILLGVPILTTAISYAVDSRRYLTIARNVLIQLTCLRGV